MSQIKQKSFAQPDEIRTFEKGKLELITLGGVTFGRATFSRTGSGQPRSNPWPTPRVARLRICKYHLPGRLHVVMEDGSEYDFIQGDISSIPPGHDAWVLGEEPWWFWISRVWRLCQKMSCGEIADLFSRSITTSL